MQPYYEEVINTVRKIFPDAILVDDANPPQVLLDREGETYTFQLPPLVLSDMPAVVTATRALGYFVGVIINPEDY